VRHGDLVDADYHLNGVGPSRHLFRHGRVRQIVRTTKSLPIARKQAGWSRLHMAYLSVRDEEVRQAMRDVRD
jgi:hypothetical protein